ESPLFVAGNVYIGFFPGRISPDSTFGMSLELNERMDFDVAKSINLEANDADYFDFWFPPVFTFTDLWLQVTGAPCQVCYSASVSHPRIGDVNDCDMVFNAPGNAHINVETSNVNQVGYMTILWDGEAGDPEVISVTAALVQRDAADHDVQLDLYTPGDLEYMKYILSGSSTNTYYTLTLSPYFDDYFFPEQFFDATAEMYVNADDDNPLPNSLNAQWSVMRGGVSYITIPRSYLGSGNMYIAVEGTAELDERMTYMANLHSDKTITGIRLNDHVHVSDQVTGDYRYFGCNVDSLANSWTVSPCRGNPELFISSMEAFPTATSYQYSVSGNWGTELFFQTGSDDPRGITYYASVVDASSTGGSTDDYELYFSAGEQRPVPEKQGGISLASGKKNSIEVTFPPAVSSSPGSSPQQIAYAVYMVPKGDGSSSAWVPSTSCGVMGGGSPLYYDLNSGSEWVVFPSIPDSNTFTITSTVAYPNEDFYVNVLAKDLENGLMSAYLPQEFSASSTWWIWVLAILGVAAAAFGIFYVYSRYGGDKRRLMGGTNYADIDLE
ncbi:hypothetical protein KIPB_004805, partial [Kipferlia bialata]